MAESSAEHSAKLFSKTLEMVPNGLNIPMYELYSERWFSRYELSGKLGILDGIPLNTLEIFESGPKLFQMVQICLSMS